MFWLVVPHLCAQRKHSCVDNPAPALLACFVKFRLNRAVPDQPRTRSFRLIAHVLLMIHLFPRNKRPVTRLWVAVLAIGLVLGNSGCNPFGRFIKQQVSIPPLLAPLVEADIAQLISVVNRVAAVRSLRGRVDIQFLDTSFAERGIAESYRTTDGRVTLQRNGKIFLEITGPFGVQIAQMTSDGERFRVAVLQGEERFRRFVRGTNNANYPRLNAVGSESGENSVGSGRGRGNGDRRNAREENNQQRTVGALSGLRPQHFTDALLVRPVAEAGSNLLYARSETFVEEPDTRAGARRNARVVRGYYTLDEFAPYEEGRARILRRFWFDRFGELRLARLQNFDDQGQLVTDVVYGELRNFGEAGRYVLPSRIELTRPQDRYSIRVTYQTPEAVTVDNEYPAGVFVLENRWQLPEVDLDATRTTTATPQQTNGSR